MPSTVSAQSNPPVSAEQKSVADSVAQKGVPLSALSPTAPDSYTIQSGDTLWAISKLFLTNPWRWPELWGMNKADIQNPHRIYPKQRLVLERRNGSASLRVAGSTEPLPPASTTAAPAPADDADIPTVKLSPRGRVEPISDASLPTLTPSMIEQFLAEPLIMDEASMAMAPRIVAAQEGRVLLTRGDRAYARGPNGDMLRETSDSTTPRRFRIFRTATPLKDPENNELLGYEAMYTGKALLVRGESSTTHSSNDSTIVPATIDIVEAKAEIRAGDYLLPEPSQANANFIPHAPSTPFQARIVSIYGSALVNATQNQVVAINRGRRDAIDAGTVLAILKNGQELLDKSDPARASLKLPNERNGLLMVFRTFERVSYALILDATDAVRVGDLLSTPR